MKKESCPCHAVSNFNSSCTRKPSIFVDSRKYYWYGGFGAVLMSYERGVKQGDIRMIGDIPFFAYRVNDSETFESYPFFSFFSLNKKQVSWTISNIDAEWIREFKAKLFC